MTNSFDVRSPGGGAGVLILRLLIAGLVGALGVALWMSGHVLIGGLILALAALRLVLFLTMRHRRRRWRPRRASQARSAPGAPVPYQPPR